MGFIFWLFLLIVISISCMHLQECSCEHMKNKKVTENHQHSFIKGKSLTPDQPDLFLWWDNWTCRQGITALLLKSANCSKTFNQLYPCHCIRERWIDRGNTRWLESWSIWLHKLQAKVLNSTGGKTLVIQRSITTKISWEESSLCFVQLAVLQTIKHTSGTTENLAKLWLCIHN